MNFRQLDLNLLRVLATIHRTRSVTAASKALSLSQPATSNALARLRHFFDDELFVRSPTGLKATRLCERVAPAVLAQLQALEIAVAGHDAFDPATSPMRWQMSMSDLGEMMFLPPLAAALRQQAPHAHLYNISVGAADVAAALDNREIDCAIGILQPRHRGIRTDLLFRERYVAIASPSWRPASGGRRRVLTRGELAQAALVVSSPTATFHSGVEEMLARMKMSDRIVMRVRHFGALPEIALTTDMLAIVPDMYARSLQQRHDLSTWELADAPAYEVRLVWHASTEKDPAHKWMRSLVHELFARAN
ncbi:transcriptional regulator [Pigmentiphaga litoralis]|uniref:LysR family transcriptional regulator n=1 Tax=Pigmentiphaga litoralis TaxID=516702 RepID=UPI0016719E36|nr:LysR family transcriptional regulator [Pigmentiphaga litoralis]GGX30941.1 transcriptional regulator [Pigmentiphaga litoralis]